MIELHLVSQKAFEWHGAGFRYCGLRVTPSVPEVEELSALLRRAAPSEMPAFTEYLQEHFGQSDVTCLRPVIDAIAWIEAEAKCCLRSISATDVKSRLQRGAMRCTWCGGWLTDGPNGNWFCSEECFVGFRSRCEPSYAKDLVWNRDKGICAACGTHGSSWEMDHIVPVSEGGGLCGLDNYQTLCSVCHRRKSRCERARAPLLPTRTLVLSELVPWRIRDLAHYIRQAPFYRRSLGDHVVFAASCLRQAIETGAFADPDCEEFRTAFFGRINCRNSKWSFRDRNRFVLFDGCGSPDGRMLAWGEACWWLRGKPKETRQVIKTFEEDCEFIAWLLNVEAARQMSRAEYQKYCRDECPEHGQDQNNTLAKNNRTFWREIEFAIHSGKSVLPQVLTEYKQLGNVK